ncbi:MAG: hypothetical protein HKN49_13830, partial [Gammaproteobacteria bacterium]|nr:hypothetical protein [Gammaproteobacteria bacterium]
MRKTLAVVVAVILLLVVGLLLKSTPQLTESGQRDQAVVPAVDAAPDFGELAQSAEVVAQPGDREPESPDGEESGCVDVGEFWSEDKIQQNLDSIEALLPTWSTSGDPDLEFAAAVISHRQGGSHNTERLLQDHPHAGPAFWQLLTHCDRSRDPGGRCAVERLTAQAEDLDGGSGEIWRVLTNQWYDKGNEEQALLALERAVAAPLLRQYWPETIRILDNALRSLGTLDATDRIALAMALAANGPRNLMLEDRCASHAEKDARWLDACVAYGRRLESEGLALLDQRIGLVIQRDMAAIMGDQPGYQAAIERLDATDGPAALIGDTDPYLAANEDLFIAYVE